MTRRLAITCSFLFLLGGSAPLYTQQDRQPLSIEEAGSRRTSLIMPFAAYEIGHPTPIDRSARAIALDLLDGSGSGLAHRTLLGIEFLFPRMINDAFGIATQLTIAQSEGSFTSRIYTDTVAAIDESSGNRVASDNRLEVASNETQGRLALTALWDIGGIRLALGPSIAYRGTSNLVETERIVAPDTALFASNRRRVRTLGSGDPDLSSRWRFGATARMSHDLFLSPTFAVSPLVGLRFDGSSLSASDDILDAFSVRAGLGFSITWRPDPVEELVRLLTPQEPVLDLSIFPRSSEGRTRSDNIAVASEVIDTILIGERITEERRMIGIPTIWSRGDWEATPSGKVGLGREDLAGRSTDEVLALLPVVLAERLRKDPSSRLRLVPQSTGTADNATSAQPMQDAEEFRSLLLGYNDIDPAQILIDPATEGQSGVAGLRVIATPPELLDPLLLLRRVVNLDRPDLAIRLNDGEARASEDPTPEGHRIVVRQDGTTIGSGLFAEETRFAIARQELRSHGGIITVDLFRSIDDVTAATTMTTPIATDTLVYRMIPPVDEEHHLWVLSGTGASDRQGTTYRAFLQLAAAALRAEAPERSLLTIRTTGGPFTIDRATILGDLLAILGNDYPGTITTAAITTAVGPRIEILLER